MVHKGFATFRDIKKEDPSVNHQILDVFDIGCDALLVRKRNLLWIATCEPILIGEIRNNFPNAEFSFRW